MTLSNTFLDTCSAVSLGTSVPRTLEDRFFDYLNILDFIPAIHHADIRAGTLTTSLTSYIQAAFDAAEGKALYVPKGLYLADDTLYQTPESAIIGEACRDLWNNTVNGTTFMNSGAGTPRKWTDRTDPGYANWSTIADPDTTTFFVPSGNACGICNVTIEGNRTTPWDIGILLPTVRGFVGIRLQTTGAFEKTGLYLSREWSSTSSNPLYDLHDTTYRTIHSNGGLNEISFTDCYFRGGHWGVMGIGTDRNPEDASSQSELVWGPGGASDIGFTNCRIGNDYDYGSKIKDGGSLYFDWGYSLDITNKDYKYSQNHTFDNCSFRSKWTRYSVVLDRSRHDKFNGYGETISGHYTTEPMTGTVDALGRVDLVSDSGTLNNLNNNPGIQTRIYLTDSARLDLIATDWQLGATITATSGGSFTLYAIGFDATASRVYFVPKNLTGTIAASDTLTQASGQNVGAVFVASERVQGLTCIGQCEFQTTAAQDNVRGGVLRSNVLQVAGTVIDEDNVVVRSKQSTSFYNDSTQMNFYVNSKRWRINGDAFFSYDQGDIGTASLPFNKGHFSEINFGTRLMLSGSGSPEGVVTAPIGSVYIRTDGGSGTAQYQKVSGSGNTGWASVATLLKGTWTPDLHGTTVAGTNTYAAGTAGAWRFDGDKFLFTFRLGLTALDAAMSGNLQIGGLPFTSNSNTFEMTSVQFCSQLSGLTLATGTHLIGSVNGGGTTIRLHEFSNTGLANITAASGKIGATFAARGHGVCIL